MKPDMPSEWMTIVRGILALHVPDRRVVLFGSRASGSPKPHSDIDLCVMGDVPLSAETTADLRDAFSASRLPVRVDVVDWATTDASFREIIEKQAVEIYPKVMMRLNSGSSTNH